MKKLTLLTFFIGQILMTHTLKADQTLVPDSLYLGADPQIQLTLNEALNLNAIKPGSVVVIGEIHDQKIQHQRELLIIQRLSELYPQNPIAVGMEFFDYTRQNLVDQYVFGKLSEPDFLSQIGWGNISFEWYKDQVLFPYQSQRGGKTLALNAPSTLTRAISKNGLEQLPDDLKGLLPPDLKLGNDLYRNRFEEAMGGGHIPPQKFENYFAAQSVWDDTMAWQASIWINQNPTGILAIIVGDFHVSFGGGLPERLRARLDLGHSIFTFSQIALDQNLTTPELLQDPRYGNRANWIWTSSHTQD